MTHVDTGYTGAKRQSWRHDNPRDRLRAIIEENPKAGKEQLLDLFTQEILAKGNKGLLETIIEYWFANNLNSLLQGDTGLRDEFLSPQAKRAAAADRAKQVQQVTANVRSRIKLAAKFVLLDMVMPNAKPLRKCTGAECEQIGGWLTQVALHMVPTALVGDTFNEQQLRAFFNKDATP